MEFSKKAQEMLLGKQILKVYENKICLSDGIIISLNDDEIISINSGANIEDDDLDLWKESDWWDNEQEFFDCDDDDYFWH